MGPSAATSLREGDAVMVRGMVEVVSAQTGLIRFTTDLQGGYRRLTMPYTEMFLADYTTNAAYEASRVMMQRIDQLREVALRVQAELYELGQLTGDAKKGLIIG